jgi:hypothetical protein
MEMRTPASNSDVVHGIIVNVSSDKEGTFVVWLIEKTIEEKVTRRKYGFALTSTKVLNAAVLL